MKAVTFDRFGGLEVLKVTQLPTPAAARGEVLVAVKASSLNVIDSRVRRGLMGPLVKKTFPKIPGSDLAGAIVAVGDGVDDLKVGDAVFGATDPFKGGAFADFVAVSAQQVARKPDALSFDEAAALPITGLAALLSIRDLGQAKRGDEILIHGASGALGLFAIQLARHFGLKITAVTGTSGVAAAKAFGADHVIDYRLQDGQHFNQAFDVIINASGQFPYAKARAFLKPAGRMIEPSPSIPVFIGSKIANLLRRQKHLMLQTAARRADLEFLARLCADGALKATVARSYPLDEAQQAFQEMEKGGVVGKIIVTT